jgi:hypothetical protein
MFAKESTMNQTRVFLSAVFVFGLMLASSLTSPGQSVEPSYEVSLQLLIGSHETSGRGDLPANLVATSKLLKNRFQFPNYRLASTLMGRISNTGSLEYKSLTNIFLQESNLPSQTFLEWSIGNLRIMPTAKGAQGFQAQSFRFGARVPVTTGSFKDDAGKMNPVINYESIGLTFGKVGLPENTPTLIGTLNLPGANGTIFLVMTINAADM